MIKVSERMNDGVIYNSNNSGEFKIIEYKSAVDVTIKFIRTGFITKTRISHIDSGNVKDKLHKVIFGVGFIGEGDYRASTKGKNTRQYKTWRGMLERCYSDKSPSYKGCTVCKEWHDFQNFAKWFDENYIEGYQIDKDIKIDGNRIYSPDACMFVSANENAVKAHAKTYSLVNPDGEVVNIYNMNEFCRDKDLGSSSMIAVSLGKASHHKGWTAI